MKKSLLCVWLSLAALPAPAQAPAPAKQSTAPAPAATPSNAATTIDPGKETAIRKLFEVQGTAKLMQQVMTGMSASMKPMLTSSLPPGEYREKLIELFFQKFQSKMNAEQLLTLMIPVYDKYFSKDDIEKLMEFYKSPMGQKFLSVQPQIVAETQAASMKMGQEIGRKSMLEVLDENPELKKALESEAATPQN